MPSIFTLEGPQLAGRTRIPKAQIAGDLGEGLVVGGPAIFGVAAVIAGAIGYGVGHALKRFRDGR